MKRIGGRAVVVVSTTLLLAAGLSAPAVASPQSGATRARSWLSGPGHSVHRGSHGEVDVDVCSQVVAAGTAHCDAHVRTDLFGKGNRPQRRVPASPRVTSNASLGNNGAYDPAFLQAAYNAPAATNGVGQTVAIVDAFDAPTIESDLGSYRSLFGLAPCTTANGCFTKIDELGGTSYPAANAGWAEEISLDVQMVSALCPNCHILLVEAASSSFADLGTAVNTAVARGATVVSNSYGANEWSGETLTDTAYYNHPGVAIVASSGDDGYGVEFPAASPNVVAVGGTTLLQDPNTSVRSATETVWSGSGSGCSAFEPKPAWQTDAGCTHRSVADVAAVADPSTGVWVYDTADGGWEVFGGTSVAAPIVGALYALAGNAPSSSQMGSLPYSSSTSLNDVVSGSNGNCGGTYLCTGSVGYDGPTGMGTANGLGAFTASGVVTPPPPPPPPPPPAPAPDFSIGASSVAPIKASTSATSTVTLTPLNGFTGTLNVTASVSPSTGLTASVSPALVALGSTPSTSAVTLSAKTGGTYTVTITASQGQVLTHTTTLTVTVNDFSLQVSPAKASVVRGRQVKYTVTLTPIGAFNSAVTLSVSGLRPRDSVSFARNPAAASSSQTVTITTSNRDASGVLSVRFTGVSGSLSHNVTVSLTLQ